MVDQIVVVSKRGAVSLLTPAGHGEWLAEHAHGSGAWPAWRPGHAQVAVSVTGGEDSTAVDLIDLGSGSFPSFATFARSAQPNAIGPRVPHYVMWSPNGSTLAIVSRAGETLGLSCHGPDMLEPGPAAVTGAPIFCSWSPDSRRLAVHAGSRVLLVDAESGEVVRTVSEAAAGFRAPAVSPSGRVVYAEPRAGALRVMETTFDREDGAEFAEFSSGVVLAFRPRSEDLTVGAAATAESGALSELWLISAGGARRRISRGPFVGYSWSPLGDKLALIVPSQTGDGRHYVRVIDGSGEELCASEAFVPSPDFRLWLAFFDQYSQSHSLWDAAGETLLLAGRRVDDSVHSSLGDPVGDKVYAWRVGRNQPLEMVAPGLTGFFSRS